MEVLRLPPYPLTTTWNLPDPNYGYIVYVEDLIDHSIEEQVITSDTDGVVTYTLPLSKVQFDRTFLIRFYDAQHEHIIYEENLDIIRPYTNPNDLGTTASEIAEARMYEMVARSMIDSYINADFKNHKRVFIGVGEGTDYYPIWDDPNRVLKVYENNVLIYNGEDVTMPITEITNPSGDNKTFNLTSYFQHNFAVDDIVTITGFVPDAINGTYRVIGIIDGYGFTIMTETAVDITAPELDLGNVKRIWEYEYKVALDNSSIYRVETGMKNRLESTTLNLPAASGDLWRNGNGRTAAFPIGFDYILILDVGYRTIPPDIDFAAKLLVDDLRCGKLEYFKRYATSYFTDQFKIKFDDKAMVNGTGNLMVDRILEKYLQGTLKLGII